MDISIHVIRRCKQKEREADILLSSYEEQLYTGFVSIILV